MIINKDVMVRNDVVLSNLIKNKGVTAYEVSCGTGISESTLSRILNKNTKPNIQNRKILAEYFNVNEDVFLNNNVENIISEPKEVYVKGVPYYDVDFTSSYLEVENSQNIQPNSYISHPFFAGCDLVVRNSGQSMAKLIAHGDAVGLVRIENWQEFFPLGEVYAIVTSNNFRMIKIITKGEDDEHYTLISKPTDSKKEDFPAQQIRKDNILAIFRVQASSHLF
jgi:transcriptional regulator with XRE-family HTH domain